MKAFMMWVATAVVATAVAWAQPMRSGNGPSPSAKPAAAAAGNAKAAEELQVDLTKATMEELEKLPGIGPSRAKAILDYQKQHGFRRVEDITKVGGIGRKTFGKLRQYLTIGGRATATGK